MLIRDPNMFEKKSRVRQIFHMPQIPAYALQVQADFELVSAISFDELSDVAIVLENKQTKQLVNNHFACQAEIEKSIFLEFK